LIDPRLGPLNFNGGLTQTMALLAGSPAIDKGDNNAALSAGLTTDQRGAPFHRIVAVRSIWGVRGRAGRDQQHRNLPANASSVTINGVDFDPTAANNSVVVTDTTTGISITVTPGTASTRR